MLNNGKHMWVLWTLAAVIAALVFFLIGTDIFGPRGSSGPPPAQMAGSETGSSSVSSASAAGNNTASGLQTDSDGNTWYYVDGSKVYGEQQVDGDWMYFSEEDGAAKDELIYVADGSKLCYYDENGVRVSGTQTINGVSCSFDSETGAMTDGQIDLLQSYCSTSGSSDEITAIGTASLASDSSALSALQDEIDAIEVDGYSVSFVMIDVSSAQGISYNSDDIYYSASAIKGPYVASAVYSDSSLLQSEYETIQNILVNSDNSAYTSLATSFGFDCFEDWVSESGAEYERIGQDHYGYFTPASFAKLWLQNYEYFSSDETGQSLAVLYETPAVSAIHSTLGSKYTTRSKGGWISGSEYNVTNDCGIVYSDSGDYIVAVMSSIPSNMDGLNDIVDALDTVHENMTAE